MACVAYGCRSRSNGKSAENKELAFHRFPSDKTLKEIWVMAVNRVNWKPSNHSRLCSKHFDSSCYVEGAKRKILRIDSVPTIFGRSSINLKQLEKDMENFMAYKIMGQVKRIQMKSDCVPSKFKCQSSSQSEEPSGSKKARINNEGSSDGTGQDLLSETSEVTVKIEQDVEASSTEETSLNQDYTSSLHEEVEIETKVEPMDDDEDNMTSSDIIPEQEVKLEVEEHSPQDEFGTKECPIFEACTRQMLPRVDMFAIVQYLLRNRELYGQIDFDKLKEDNNEVYADDTIGHVQIHKSNASVTLQCSVAFNRTTLHTCLIKYNIYSKSIECTNCECDRKACEHIIAFLMWIHRRSEERIDNDMSFNLEPMTQETTFIKAKDLALDDTDSASDSGDCPDSGPLRDDIVQEFIMKCVQRKQFNSPLYKYLCSDELKDLSMHRLISEFVKEGAAEGAEPDIFISYCRDRLRNRSGTVERLETAVDNDVRQELEYGRIDAQHLLAAAEEDQSIIDELMFPELNVEDSTIEEIRTIIDKKLNTKIKRTGIFLSTDKPMFCAAPYGVTDKYVVDISYVKDGQKIEDFLLNGVLTDGVKAKLQLYMNLTCRRNSKLFLGYKDENNKKQIQIHDYPYNESLCSELMENAGEYWKKYVYMKLLL